MRLNYFVQISMITFALAGVVIFNPVNLYLVPVVQNLQTIVWLQILIISTIKATTIFTTIIHYPATIITIILFCLGGIPTQVFVLMGKIIFW